MSRNLSPPTLQDIADKTGYGRSTISLALRNHPSLPIGTRKKIQDAAQKMGYRPNPLVAALMTQLRGRKTRYQATLALLTCRSHPYAEDAPPLDFYRILYRAMMVRAEECGFGVDIFSMDREKLSGRRLSKILLARGIHGVLLFPGGKPNVDFPDLDWEHFSTVLVGFNPKWAFFDQVVSDYTHDIDLALEMAVKHGSRRIGFGLTELRDRNSDYSWASRFLLYQRNLRARERLPFIPSRDDLLFDREVFLAWVEKHRPDTMLIAGGEQYEWLKEAGWRVPEDIRLINLVQRKEKELAGIDPRTEEVGRASIDHLISLLQSNQAGIPGFPRLVSVKGRWVDGPSFLTGK